MSFFIVLFAFILVSSTIQSRAKERRARLEVIERALARPDLDAETRRKLTEALEPQGSRFVRGLRATLGGSPFGPRHAMLSVGWIGIFLGIGIGTLAHGPDAEVGVVVLLGSIGLLTLPFALREFEKRRPA